MPERIKMIVTCRVIRQTGDIMELECDIPDLGTTKRKRKLSAYNEFMRECLRRRTEPIQERFKICAEEYKRNKK